MSNLISETPEAKAWAEAATEALKSRRMFRAVGAGVVWLDVSKADEGRPILIDPEMLAQEINEFGQPLLLGHDPGKPLGRMVSAKAFTGRNGKRFVAAAFGYYDAKALPGFTDFGFEPEIIVPPPRSLPDLRDDLWIEIATDPREVAAAWVDDVASGAPFHLKRRTLSHNAAEAAVELIRVTVPYLALAGFASLAHGFLGEAGKDGYRIFQKWIKRLITRAANRSNPVLVLQASLEDADVMFILRGNNLDTLIAASDGLGQASLQAEHLVSTLKHRNILIATLYYEFDAERKRWMPSYSELRDGRLMTDNKMLVVAERIPKGLSIGFGGFVSDD